MSGDKRDRTNDVVDGSEGRQLLRDFCTSLCLMGFCLHLLDVCPL